MSFISKILGTDRPPTAADLRRLRASLSVDEAERRVEALEGQRRLLLVDGSDSQLVDIEQQIAAANLECERQHARVAEVDRRIIETTAREASDGLSARRAAVEKQAAALSRRLQTEYTDHANALVSLLYGVVVADSDVAAVNQDLIAAGRHAELLKQVELRAFRGPAAQFEGARLTSQIRLAPISGEVDGWGPVSNTGLVGLIDRGIGHPDWLRLTDEAGESQP